jgi:ATP-dependent HslUV protease subunit HslV
LSTLTVARKDGRIAIASDALTTFDETRLPPDNDAAPEKIVRIGDAYVGIVGFTAHHLVIQDALERMPEADFSTRRGIFETFRLLHPILKDEYYLLPESGEEGDPYESTQISILVASPHGIFGVYDMREVHEFKRFWAMGSGFAYALGAMEARYDAAPDAAALATAGVEVGCAFDRSSALPVSVFEMDVSPDPPAPVGRPSASPARRRGSARRGR